MLNWSLMLGLLFLFFTLLNSTATASDYWQREHNHREYRVTKKGKFYSPMHRKIFKNFIPLFLPNLGKPAPAIRWNKLEKRDKVYINPFTIKGKHTAVKGIEIVPKTFYQHPNDRKKCVVVFVGRGGFYKYKLQDSINQSLITNSCHILFHYRGMGRSTPTASSFADLVDDGINQVHRILNLGLSPKNIILDGYSLGGAVSIYVAEYFAKKGQKLKVFVDRSFSLMSLQAAHELKNNRSLESLPPRLRHLPLSVLLSLAGWNAKPIQALKSIHPDHIDIVNSVRDQTILYANSLVHAIQKSPEMIGYSALTFEPLSSHHANSHHLRRSDLFNLDQNESLSRFFQSLF